MMSVREEFGRYQIMFHQKRSQYGIQFPGGSLDENLVRAEKDGLDGVTGGVYALTVALQNSYAPDPSAVNRLVKLMVKSRVFADTHPPQRVERFGMLLEALMSSPATTSAELEPLFMEWLTGLCAQGARKRTLADILVAYDEDEWVKKAADARFKTMVEGVAVHGSVPLMGTLWRVLAAHLPLIELEQVNDLLIAGGRMPLPVFARFSPQAVGKNVRRIDTDQFTRKWDKKADLFWKQVEEQMPDLAGLPHAILLDVFISQSVPDEWLVDVLPVGEVTWLGPGVESPTAPEKSSKVGW